MFEKFLNKNNFKAKRFYFKLFITFIVLIFVIIVSTSFLFSSIYIDSLYNNLSDISLKNIERLSIEFDNIFNSVKLINAFIKENSDSSYYLNEKEIDFLNINKTQLYLKQLQYSNPYIHSITLYNKYNSIIVSTGKDDIELNQFLSNQVKILNANIKDCKMVISSISQNTHENVNHFGTLSLVFSEGTNDDIINDNAVIINIDKEEIEKKLIGQYKGITYITDNNGRIIFSSYTPTNKDEFINKSIFDKIIDSTNIKGNLKVKEESGTEIVSFAKSIETDFYIINTESFDIINGDLQEARNKIIKMGIIFIFIFSLIGYFASRIIYTPISKITEMFSKSKFSSSNDKMSEVALISKVYNQISGRIEKLEIQSEANQIKLKGEYLRNLLSINEISEEFKTEMKDYDYNIEFDSLIIITTRIDKYNKVDVDKRCVYIATLCRTIPNLLGKIFKCETVDLFDGEIAILLNYKNKEENSFKSLIEALANLTEISKKTLGISLTIGIGGVAISLDDCYRIYKKAVNMANHSFMLGTGSVYHHRLLEEKLISNPIYPQELEDRNILAIKLNKKDSFIKNLNDIIELLKSFPYSEAVTCFFQIASSSIKTINIITSKHNTKYNLSFNEFNRIFSSLDTLDSAREWLINIFEEYQLLLYAINQCKDNKYFGVVEKIQKIIKLEYSDMNLTVESLAESVGYTPYYFSKIFKEIVGTNIPNFIRNTRIEKAKELLSDDKIKINEIPEMVGLTNLSHFYTVFKKNVGITPASYREYFNSQKQEQ